MYILLNSTKWAKLISVSLQLVKSPTIRLCCLFMVRHAIEGSDTMHFFNRQSDFSNRNFCSCKKSIVQNNANCDHFFVFSDCDPPTEDIHDSQQPWNSKWTCRHFSTRVQTSFNEDQTLKRLTAPWSSCYVDVSRLQSSGFDLLNFFPLSIC